MSAPLVVCDRAPTRGCRHRAAIRPAGRPPPGTSDTSRPCGWRRPVRASESALRSAGTVVAIGVYAEPCQVHMGVVWIKGLTLRTGQANVIGHVDRVLGMLAAGTLDPTPLVTHHMDLNDAPEGYAIYDRREALKIVLRP